MFDGRRGPAGWVRGVLEHTHRSPVCRRPTSRQPCGDELSCKRGTVFCACSMGQCLEKNNIYSIIIYKPANTWENIVNRTVLQITEHYERKRCEKYLMEINSIIYFFFNRSPSLEVNPVSWHGTKPRSETTISRQYQYLLRGGIEPANRIAAVDCSSTAPNG